MTDLHSWLAVIYGAPLALVLWLYLRRLRRRETRAAATLQRSLKTGLTEPPSIHPVIDPAICVGSGACTRACPEGVLGMLNGKAYLVNPTVCIGHGACLAACPVEAIKLVFGTERRGIDIPYVKPNFETNVPGIYIAGELGGMGLIRKAAEQGRQAIESISRYRAEPDELDVVIVGAGPAGLSATLAAMDKKLRFVTLEQEESLGGTVYHYPRHKVVMTQAVTLALVGKVKLTEVFKEALLEFWQGIVTTHGVPLSFGQCVQQITPVDRGFIVKTARTEYKTRSVLLAIGRRGTPRKLGVPGEVSPYVVYKLIDAEQYQNRRVIVVGGGDSAIEAAVAIATQPGAHATLSYRGEVFGHIKPQNRDRLAEAERSGQLTVLLGSNVVRIEPGSAILELKGQTMPIENDVVIVCAGGVLPTPMLKQIGIEVETKFGTA